MREVEAALRSPGDRLVVAGLASGALVLGLSWSGSGSTSASLGDRGAGDRAIRRTAAGSVAVRSSNPGRCRAR